MIDSDVSESDVDCLHYNYIKTKNLYPSKDLLLPALDTFFKPITMASLIDSIHLMLGFPLPNPFNFS